MLWDEPKIFFLERRYFFSIILSEFLKNRVALQLPKVKELDAEYSNLLTEKKARYPDYRKAKEEMQELLRAKRNVELFFAEEKSSAEKTKSR